MKCLIDLYHTFYSRSAVILNRFMQAHGSECDSYTQEMCVVRLYDLWDRFCKELILLSAYAEPISISGSRIPRVAGVRTRNDVLTKLKSIRPYASRPVHLISWGNPTTSIDVASKLKLSNFQNISLSLGATPSPLQDLRIVRNYLAHRNEKTASEVRKVAVSNGCPGTHNALAILGSLRTPGVSLLEFWIVQIRNIARYAVDY